MHGDAREDMSELHAVSFMCEQHCFRICATNSGDVSFKQAITVFLIIVVSMIMSNDVLGFKLLNFSDWFHQIGMRPHCW
jgi:hypothetical protein